MTSQQSDDTHNNLYYLYSEESQACSRLHSQYKHKLFNELPQKFAFYPINIDVQRASFEIIEEVPCLLKISNQNYNTLRGVKAISNWLLSQHSGTKDNGTKESGGDYMKGVQEMLRRRKEPAEKR